MPPRYERLNQAVFVSPEEMIRDFVGANPALKPDQFAIACGGPGNRLKEIRVCFSREGEFRACGRNEDQARLCPADRMYVPPARLGGDGPRPESTDRKRPAPSDELLPGPRERRL